MANIKWTFAISINFSCLYKNSASLNFFLMLSPPQIEQSFASKLWNFTFLFMSTSQLRYEVNRKKFIFALIDIR